MLALGYRSSAAAAPATMHLSIFCKILILSGLYSAAYVVRLALEWLVRNKYAA